LAFLVQTRSLLFKLQLKQHAHLELRICLQSTFAFVPSFRHCKRARTKRLGCLAETSTRSIEALDWLQERLAKGDERAVELAKRFSKVHNLSMKEQLKPTLDWMQASVGSSDEELAKLSQQS
jgi:hypothetical protein